jgi:hypothetical protein
MSVPLFRVDDGEGSWGAGRTAWGHRTKALRASLWHAGNVGWQIAGE